MLRCCHLDLCWMALLSAVSFIGTVHAFVPSSTTRPASRAFSAPSRQPFLVATTRPVSLLRNTETNDDSTDKEHDNNDEEDEFPNNNKNPYADPSYPNLEFIDYSDPNYVVDQGVSDEMFVSDSTLTTEQEVEAMREERRRRNDEFQFQTFFANILQQGEEFKGEWTVYKTSTFLGHDNVEEPPRLVKAKHPLHVMRHSEKIVLQDDSLSTQFPVERERIVQHQRLASAEEVDVTLGPQAQQMAEELLRKPHGPAELCPADFRGPQGIMCVSTAYTLATGVPLDNKATTTTTQQTDGPFAEYRTEVGLATQELRYNIQLDYAVLEQDEKEETNNDNAPPSLHLRSLVVGREMRGVWPSNSNQLELDNDAVASASEALFGVPGADNGLYDPPPVGSDDQAALYLQLDLDGHATALFPYRMDQLSEGNGWVVSLDWTPNDIRYQVDRKVLAGPKLLGLRTLELSEVQAAQAETYRPRGPREDMRQ